MQPVIPPNANTAERRLEWEILSRQGFTDPAQAQVVGLDWCSGPATHYRRHSSANMMSPIDWEHIAAPDREARTGEVRHDSLVTTIPPSWQANRTIGISHYSHREGYFDAYHTRLEPLIPVSFGSAAADRTLGGP